MIDNGLDDIVAQHGKLNIWMDLDKRTAEIYDTIYYGYAAASKSKLWMEVAADSSKHTQKMTISGGLRCMWTEETNGLKTAE